tara:strand:- start:1546 stop:2163 length:618 start_codon:yes stop_codon:yes gene_type:complete
MIKSKIAHYRLLISKTLLVLFIGTLFISNHGSLENGNISLALKSIGFILILVGCAGRLWCSLYIEGNKNVKLITTGPYSIVRNPLYVFSVMLILGYALAIQSIIVVGLMLILFLLIYLPTVYNEEKILLSMHIDSYKKYYDKTPRFWPDFKLYSSQEKDTLMDVNIKKIQRVIIEIAGFTFFYGLIILIDLLHQSGSIKTYFTLY